MTESALDQRGPAEEAMHLCREILRISGGSPEVTFGALVHDEHVTQTFEAVMGTLKAARKRNLLDFEGELLLSPGNDDCIIRVNEAELASSPVQPRRTSPETQSVERKATTPMAAADSTGGTSVAHSPSERQEQQAVDLIPNPSQADTTEDGKWQPVDTSYINHRTANVDNLEGRRCSSTLSDSANPSTSVVPPSATVKKECDGKWKVDTSYISCRTSQVENLEGKQHTSSKEGSLTMPIASSTVKKEGDGKWKVDTSYINHRTAEVDNLEGKQAAQQGSADLAPISATVRKDSGGWKVDTSYIGYRTADPANLNRNVETVEETNYADPGEHKFEYDALKGVCSLAEVNPACKELYLSDEEFPNVFGMCHTDFVKLPKWKQVNLKKAQDLF